MGGIWLPATLDLEKATFVKAVGDDTKYADINGKGSVYYDSTTGIVTDIDYEDLKTMFIEINMLYNVGVKVITPDKEG